MEFNGDVVATIVGAIIVALITAYTTNRRLDTQLWHDRAEANRADLRDVLDDAAAAAIEALQRAGTVSAGLEQRLDDPSTNAVVEGAVRSSITELLASISNLTPHTARITLRLSRNADATEAYWKLRDIGNDLTRGIPDPLPASDEEAREFLRHAETFSAQVRTFLAEANDLVGAHEL